jgi:hypothetical protein
MNADQNQGNEARMAAEPTAAAAPQNSPRIGKPTRRESEASTVGRDHPRALSDRVNYWSTIITAITATVALIISGYTFMQVNTRPEMIISLPRLVSLVNGYRGPNSQPELDLIMQPTFYVYEKTDVTSVVSDLTIDVRDVTVADGIRRFWWIDNIEYIDDPSNPTVVIPDWEADPRPIIVQQDSPQAPAVRFTTPDAAGSLRPSTWDVTLTVTRLKQEPIRLSFCIELGEAAIQQLNAPLEPGGLHFWDLRTVGSLIVEERDGRLDDCYTG